MTEELEQLLKNLKLRRMLEIYDEQLRAAEKDDSLILGVRRRDCCARNGTTGRKARWSGASSAPICPSAGRWKRFPGRASPA